MFSGNLFSLVHVLLAAPRMASNSSISPKPFFFFLPQVEVSLDHLEDMLGFIIRQAGQVQLPPHDSMPNTDENTRPGKIKERSQIEGRIKTTGG